ncbi:MAG: ATP-binding protein [Deltaproteobacteria bacterium]|nr:ATP-binding protein [Deltaproteobacteria bacterium]
MIEGEYYFVLHAPRQSGKTTCLNALTEQINSDGRYYAITCSLYTLRNIKEIDKAMSGIVGLIDMELIDSGVDKLSNLAFSFKEEHYIESPLFNVRGMLRSICRSLDRELIVFFDEADCLHEDPLITFLSQLRDGYLNRDKSKASVFPRSMALVGMRDIRDYRHRVRPDDQSALQASPFNVITKSFSLANFGKQEIESLYSQHTADTGQIFAGDAIERAWYWTEGQPWLVNAVASNVIVDQFQNDYSRIVTANEIDIAVHDLILQNAAHFDSIANRLREPRVRRVIESVVVGAESFPKGVSDDDAGYVVDLGYIIPESATKISYRPANPIYNEVLARILSRNIQESLPDDLASKWMDGTSIDMKGLLEAFQLYWSLNREAMTENNRVETLVHASIDDALENYRVQQKKDEKNVVSNTITEKIAKKIRNDITDLADEAFAHLVLFAFLQRVMNGGAEIQREMAMGNTKCDICVIYKDRLYPLELKIKKNMNLKKSYAQLYGYMDKCGSHAGWLIVFDMNFKKFWKDKISWEEIDYMGKTIHLVGC